MINGHLINHYYIIELFNDLMGKNRFPQSNHCGKASKNVPFILIINYVNIFVVEIIYTEITDE